MGDRKPLSKRTRFRVFKRDGFTCQYCGRKPPVVVLEADHVIPVADGEPDSEYNLVKSCFDCNCGKSDEPLRAVPPGVNDRILEAREREEQVKSLERMLKRQRKQRDQQISELYEFWLSRFLPADDARCYAPSPSEASSLRTFLDRLAPTEIMDAIEIAHARKPVTVWKIDPATGRLTMQRENQWKYFCGVCWGKIKRPNGGTER